MKPHKKVIVILGNQLFPLKYLRDHKDALIFMAEDHASCSYIRHHKHKLVLILSAMRAYADALRKAGFAVHYEKLSDDRETSYMDKLHRVMTQAGANKLLHFEIEDKSMERRVQRFVQRHDYRYKVIRSPMFITTREEFGTWRSQYENPRMAEFYKWQRQRTGILLDSEGQPIGGRWSFDSENRKPLPAALPLPPTATARVGKRVRDVAALVEKHFPNHPGNTENFALPVTRDASLAWLNDFLEQRFTLFGDYEDALTTRSDQVFHSMLSPLMNIGLLTPADVYTAALDFAETEKIALNNVEGFLRQIIGWREFMRGIYQTDGDEMLKSNFWNHQRRLRPDWYRSTTGILPLDLVIAKANRLGWAHHIERLMVAGNMMLLAEIHPREAYQWFMEMFVDSAEWVMVPNVFGMALFADGGLFTTKPYVCGSNYLRRMGDYPAGDWTTIQDGLFWRFIAKHRSWFAEQPRLGMLCGHLDNQSRARKTTLSNAAESFLYEKTDSVREVA